MYEHPKRKIIYQGSKSYEEEDKLVVGSRDLLLYGKPPKRGFKTILITMSGFIFLTSCVLLSVYLVSRYYDWESGKRAEWERIEIQLRNK